jgi:hypothetical protein
MLNRLGSGGAVSVALALPVVVVRGKHHRRLLSSDRRAGQIVARAAGGVGLPPRVLLSMLKEISRKKQLTQDILGRLSDIESQAVAKMRQFSFKELSQAYNLYGKMRAKPSKVMLCELEMSVLSRMDEFGTQGISNILVGYARMDLHPGENFALRQCGISRARSRGAPEEVTELALLHKNG